MFGALQNQQNFAGICAVDAFVCCVYAAYVQQLLILF